MSVELLLPLRLYGAFVESTAAPAASHCTAQRNEVRVSESGALMFGGLPDEPVRVDVPYPELFGGDEWIFFDEDRSTIPLGSVVEASVNGGRRFLVEFVAFPDA